MLELAQRYSRQSMERRILLALPHAARSLTVNDEMAKEAGWFDPVIVGSSAFAGTQGDEHRRKKWDLTSVSQRWLRDLLWEYLRDEALQPAGKRPCARTVYLRISGIVLLSHGLRQCRGDRGNNPTLLSLADAKSVKDLWDLWHQEQIPIPRISSVISDKDRPLSARTRQVYMFNIRTVLQHSKSKGRTPSDMDAFILGLPEYAMPAKRPRPRPLTYGDFQLLVRADKIATLEEADADDIGLADIWLTQAFQGGRISETLKLRLGCVGLVGAAQPYIWRDISKVNVVDYGMPCYLPVYERLLRRREKTLAKLRARYADQLASLDTRGRARLETSGIAKCRCSPA